MPDVAVVGYARTPITTCDPRDEVELVQAVVADVFAQTGLKSSDVGFTCSGSCDLVAGMPFSFVGPLDGARIWPTAAESHVEMDGAWALYEAWVRLQHGDIQAALVYAFGKPSAGDLDQVLNLQLDPYTLAPLGIRANELAALHASAAGLDRGQRTPVSDGAAAILLATGDLAAAASNKAWIRGIDHRIDAHQPGSRDLTDVASARLAAERAGASNIDHAELHAAYPFERALLRRAMGLTQVPCPAIADDPFISTGLVNIGEAAKQIWQGKAQRTLGHAASGPCLQQNLVCVLEAAT
jgi:hypothetical protein